MQREAGFAALLVAIPAFALAGPVGPFRAPGLEGDGLYGALLSGAITRQWISGAAPVLTEGVTGGPYWPASPMGALVQALLPVDSAFALGLVVAFAWWLAGYGAYRLARVTFPESHPAACFAAGVAAQTSAVLLRALPGADLAALAIGPIALGLAHPALAWVGGLWSLPGAVVFSVAGLLGRKPAWLVAGVPALGLLVAPSALPGALQRLPGPSASAPAYVADSGAAFPLPPAEAAPLIAAADIAGTGLWIAPDLEPNVRGSLHRGGPPGMPPTAVPGPHPGLPAEGGAGPPGLPPAGAPTLPGGQPVPAPDGPPVASPPPLGAASAFGPPPGAAPAVPTIAAPDDRPAIGELIVPLQRLHGGPVALVGLLLALALAGTRRFGVAGLVSLGVITGVYGWQAAPGELEMDPSTVRTLLLALDAADIARLPGGAGAALSWGAIPVVLGGPALAWAISRVWAVAIVAVLGIPLENPRLALPVIPFPPDPLRDTLVGVDPGGVLAFPAPQFPYLQGQRPPARWQWEMAEARRATDDGGGETAVAGLVRALTVETGIPIDTQAAEALWAARGEDPFDDARAAGWRYLLVDLDALPEDVRPRLDGWLAERIGTPVARDATRLLYDLSGGPTR